jgi:hypothetical protein
MSKYQIGYIIYGLIAVVFVIGPSVAASVAGKEAPFPTLFRTVAYLERRQHWVALLILAGLAVLAVHLAMYPWPDIPRVPAH